MNAAATICINSKKKYVFTAIIYNFLKNQIPQTEIKYELKTKFANSFFQKKKPKPKTQSKKQLNRSENLHAQCTKHNTSDIKLYVFKKCKTYSALGYL